MGVVSRICTKLGAIADWCTRDTKKPVTGVLAAVAETLDPLDKLGRGLVRIGGKKVNNKDTCIFRYRLSPETFEYSLVCMKSSRT